MTHAIQTTHQDRDHQAQVARDLEQLTHSLTSLRISPRSRLDAEAALPALTEPANPVWLMARIAALLSPYYEKDIPQAVRRLEAEDWAAELGEYPQWAVEKAVRWWKSSDNADRRKRPFEGDISARCRVEMGPVNAAKIYLSQPLQSSPRECEPHERQEPSEVDVAHRRKVAAEIMADFNKGKGFPKVGEGKE